MGLWPTWPNLELLQTPQKKTYFPPRNPKKKKTVSCTPRYNKFCSFFFVSKLAPALFLQLAVGLGGDEATTIRVWNRRIISQSNLPLSNQPKKRMLHAKLWSSMFLGGSRKGWNLLTTEVCLTKKGKKQGTSRRGCRVETQEPSESQRL